MWLQQEEGNIWKYVMSEMWNSGKDEILASSSWVQLALSTEDSMQFKEEIPNSKHNKNFCSKWSYFFKVTGKNLPQL